VDLSGYIAIGVADLVVAMHEANQSRLITDLENLLALARLLRDQPTATLQNYCTHTLTVLGLVLEMILSERLLDGEALLRLQLQIERVNDLEVLSRTLSVERARILDNWGNPDRRMGQSSPLLLSAGHGLLSLVGSYDQFLVRILREFEQARRIAPEPRWQGLKNPAFVSSLSFQTSSLISGRFNSYPNILFGLFYNDTLIESRLEQLRTALAAERYRLNHNRFPQNQQALVPRFLDRLAVDAFTGELLECREVSGNLIVSSPIAAGERLFIPQRLQFTISGEKAAAQSSF